MSLMDLDDGQGVFALLGSGGKHGKNIENWVGFLKSIILMLKAKPTYTPLFSVLEA